MKVMKKVAAIALAITTVVSLTACGTPENTVFSADDLPGKTIGVQLGTTGDIYATDYEEEGSTIDRYSKGADAIQSLKHGKVDCVIIDEQPALAFIEKNDDLKILDDPFALEDYAICIAKENAELKDKINTALTQLIEEGTVQDIIDNYIGDNAGESPYESPSDVDRSNGELVMATNAYFPPYEYYESQEVVGIDVDIAQAICDVLGMTLVVEDMEFDSIITAVQSGRADVGIAGMTITEDRLKNIDFTESYITSKQVIVVRKK